MSDFVGEGDLDYLKILGRGGANGGDENYALFRCPVCGRIYLTDYEVDTVFLDADDLAERVSIPGENDGFSCVGCGTQLNSQSIWRALRTEDGTEDWRVTWKGVNSNHWAWAVKPEHR